MAPETPFLHFVQIQVLKSALMTVVCDRMTVNVLPESFERTVIALPWAAEEALRARRDVQMVTFVLRFHTEMQSQLVVLLVSDVQTSLSTISSASQRVCRLQIPLQTFSRSTYMRCL